MTKTHFEAIARILNSQVPYDYDTQSINLEDLTSDLADYFESINPHFSRKMFLDAVNA